MLAANPVGLMTTQLYQGDATQTLAAPTTIREWEMNATDTIERWKNEAERLQVNLGVLASVKGDHKLWEMNNGNLQVQAWTGIWGAVERKWYGQHRERVVSNVENLIKQCSVLLTQLRDFKAPDSYGGSRTAAMKEVVFKMRRNMRTALNEAEKGITTALAGQYKQDARISSRLVVVSKNIQEMVKDEQFLLGSPRSFARVAAGAEESGELSASGGGGGGDSGEESSEST